MIQCPHHLTQRGNHQQPVFLVDQDRQIYLELVKKTAAQCGVQILGYCLMPNHVHWIVTPEREDSMAKAFGRAHSRYSYYFQARMGTTGHLWQNRFYSCAMDARHLSEAMRYVEQNPVRSGAVRRAEDYAWSSARAHVSGHDAAGVVDVAAWIPRYSPAEWRQVLRAAAEREAIQRLQRCTYSGKPLGKAGGVELVQRMTG